MTMIGAAISTSIPLRRPFAPTNFAGVVLWLRADVGVEETGAGVSLWPDQSGNGNDLTQTTDARRPQTASWSNGLDAIEFVRASDHFMNLALSDASGAYTHFCALRQDLETTDPQFVFRHNAAECGILSVTQTADEVGIWDAAYQGSGTAAVSGEQIITWQLDEDANTFDCRRDGADIGSGTFAGNASNWSVPRIGGYGGAGFAFDGLIAEWITYNRTLSGAEIAQVESYLATRYGVTL